MKYTSVARWKISGLILFFSSTLASHRAIYKKSLHHLATIVSYTSLNMQAAAHTREPSFICMKEGTGCFKNHFHFCICSSVSCVHVDVVVIRARRELGIALTGQILSIDCMGGTGLTLCDIIHGLSLSIQPHF